MTAWWAWTPGRGPSLKSGWTAGRRPASTAMLACSARSRASRVKPAYVRGLLPRLARKAGIDKRVHAHGLRHTHAYELAGEGTPLHVIQAQLGHSLGGDDRPLHQAPEPVRRGGGDEGPDVEPVEAGHDLPDARSRGHVPKIIATARLDDWVPWCWQVWPSTSRRGDGTQLRRCRPLRKAGRPATSCPAVSPSPAFSGRQL